MYDVMLKDVGGNVPISIRHAMRAFFIECYGLLEHSRAQSDYRRVSVPGAVCVRAAWPPASRLGAQNRSKQGPSALVPKKVRFKLLSGSAHAPKTFYITPYGTVLTSMRRIAAGDPPNPRKHVQSLCTSTLQQVSSGSFCRLISRRW